MAPAYNVEQNKLSILDALLLRLFNEQKIKLKVDSKDRLEIPSNLKSKIEGTLNVRANLLSKTLEQKNDISTDKQIETLIGNFYYYTNQFDKATIFYDKASKMDPKFIEPIFNKGDLLAKIGKHEEAILCYDIALSIDPNYFDALCSKGDSLVTISKHNEAIATRESPLEHNASK